MWGVSEASMGKVSGECGRRVWGKGVGKGVRGVGKGVRGSVRECGEV